MTPQELLKVLPRKKFDDITLAEKHRCEGYNQAIDDCTSALLSLSSVEGAASSDYEFGLIKALHSIVDRVPRGLRIDTLDFMQEVEAYIENKKALLGKIPTPEEMKKIIKYKVSGDMKELLGYFEDGTDELSKLEKWILNMFTKGVTHVNKIRG